MGLWANVRTGFILTRIGVKTGINLVKGTVGTAKDVLSAGNALYHGHAEDVAYIAVRRLDRTVRGTLQAVSSAVYLADEAINRSSDPKSGKFLTPKNEVHLVKLASLAVLGGGIGLACLDINDIGDAHCSDAGLISDLNLEGIDNGVFIGSDDDLQELIRAGQIEDTDHQDSDEYERDIGARQLFLKEHGFSYIPEGYEVHHIIPLCEGGADTPDNMVLVRSDIHDAITCAHSQFYGWHKA